MRTLIALADVGREAAEVGEQLDQVDLDVTGVGAALDGRGVDAGVPLVAQLGPRAGLALGEGADHAEHVVDLVGLAGGRARAPPGGARRERPAQRLVGAGLELAGPPAAAYGGTAQRVEQHRLADAAQPGQHQRALRAAAGDPLQHDVERRQLLVAAGELGRALAGAGGVRVPDRVHDGTVSGCLALAVDRRGACREPQAVSPEGGRAAAPTAPCGGWARAGRPRRGRPAARRSCRGPRRRPAGTTRRTRSPATARARRPPPRGARRPAARGRTPRASRKIDPVLRERPGGGHAPIVLRPALPGGRDSRDRRSAASGPRTPGHRRLESPACRSCPRWRRWPWTCRAGCATAPSPPSTSPRSAPLKTFDPPLQALEGTLVDGVTRHGKFLDIDASGLHLVIHLARAGWIRWRDEVPTVPPRAGSKSGARAAGRARRRQRARRHRGRHQEGPRRLRRAPPRGRARHRLAGARPAGRRLHRRGVPGDPGRRPAARRSRACCATRAPSPASATPTPTRCSTPPGCRRSSPPRR